ncbi:hypothetical protein J5X84_23120 [Streptosporangiaceae bacterium NEAU-GS5]|nr:hypothetical protein [Streptosporangiaceae bacterium NEAU-GS5]
MPGYSYPTILELSMFGLGAPEILMIGLILGLPILLIYLVVRLALRHDRKRREQQ